MIDFNTLNKTDSDNIDNVVSLESYLIQKFIRKQSPFVRLPLYLKVVLYTSVYLLRAAQAMVGEKFYVKNDLRELYSIDSRFRNILTYLISKNIIQAWNLMPNYPDAPHMIRYAVYLNLIGPVTGLMYEAEGFGTADNKNEALLPAIAEALERQSSYVWKTDRIISGSYNELINNNQLVMLDYFSSKQRENPANEKMADKNSSIGWTPASSFLTGDKYLVPAQAVYVLYENENSKEDVVMSSSTSGVAAGSSYEHAASQALCELIERDALMGFWLNRIPPPIIDLKTISIGSVSEKIEALKKHNLELFILDITTDIGIPTFCAVLRDSTGQVPVSMSAVTDFDKSQALDKLMLEIGKYAHYREGNTVDLSGTVKKSLEYNDVFTMEERRSLWTRPEMFKEIDFFLKGASKDFRDIPENKTLITYRDKLDEIKRIFSRKNMDGYLVDVSSNEANKFGLSVVRAIAPELVPIHFSEKRKHLGSKRLYNFPVLLGLATEKSIESSINVTPHPFL